jgi:DNA-binding Xre family transcriptional regulator
MSKNKYLGSDFDDFLTEKGLLGEVEALAIKRILVGKLEQAMHKRGLSKTDLAKSMQTSRAALNRLLDQNNTSVTLHTMVKAAKCLDQKITISLQRSN